MVWTTTTLSSLEEIFMDLLKLTKQTETWHLLLQWLYLTLRALRTETISWILQPYNICFTHKPTTVLRHLPTHVKERTNPTTDREQFARSNARTARLPTLVRQADWLRLTEHKQATRKDDANNHIIFHRLRSKYMRQQMVGISQLVLQTTFNTNRRANPPKENNTRGLGIPTRSWDLDLVVPWCFSGFFPCASNHSVRILLLPCFFY